jgi:hypothetical protein
VRPELRLGAEHEDTEVAGEDLARRVVPAAAFAVVEAGLRQAADLRVIALQGLGAADVLRAVAQRVEHVGNVVAVLVGDQVAGHRRVRRDALAAEHDQARDGLDPLAALVVPLMDVGVAVRPRVLLPVGHVDVHVPQRRAAPDGQGGRLRPDPLEVVGVGGERVER